MTNSGNGCGVTEDSFGIKAFRMTGSRTVESGSMPDSREQLRTTFESAAALYHQARPDYPDELFDALVAMAALAPGAELLEVGCATGKATVPLARRGFRITGVELGAALAAQARRNLAEFPQVSVINADFERWEPATPAGFDLVYAANAWHWIDPDVGYARARELLKPSGHLAFWGALHVVPDGGDPFFAELQDVYDEIGEGMPSGTVFPTPETLADSAADIEASGLFTDIRLRRFDWEIKYTAQEYIELLDTFSGHIAMAQWQRMRLYGEIRRRLAARQDGRVRRHWGGVLHVARRRA
jgi:SAM-dependent methyltransferase